MSVTEQKDSLTSCKTTVCERLEQFLNERKDAIGNPYEWTLHNINFGNAPYVQFKKDTQYLTFTLPKGLSDIADADKGDLRIYLRALIADSGFSVPPVRPHLSPHILNAVKAGNKEAQGVFFARHLPKWRCHADKRLTPDTSIANAGDVVNDTILGFLNTYDRDQHGEPQPYILQGILMNVTMANNPRRKGYRLESGIGEPDTIVAPSDANTQEFQEALHEQLPRVIAQAKEKLTERQEAVLDHILEHSDPPHTLKQISKESGITAERVRQHMQKITAALYEAAKEEGCEEALAAIHWLKTANEKKGWVRR